MGDEMKETRNGPDGEIWGSKAIEAAEIVEKTGMPYPFEVMYGGDPFTDGDPDLWFALSKEEKCKVAERAGLAMGVNLLTFTDDDIVRTYSEEGVDGTRSEGGANVSVLKTNNPAVDVHIFDYAKEETGRIYQFMPAED